MPIPQQILDSLPTGPLPTAALTLAETSLHPAILNHSLRVYLLAKHLGTRDASPFTTPPHLPLLFVACICHDFGSSDSYNGAQRFEVEGADAASALCRSHGVSEADAHQVWVAIALHTSPGIAERIDGFTRAVREAVKMDFSMEYRERFGVVEYAREIEEVLPRLDVERELADAVVRQAGKIEVEGGEVGWPDSRKHPIASWPGILLKAHLENPKFDGVNPAF